MARAISRIFSVPWSAARTCLTSRNATTRASTQTAMMANRARVSPEPNSTSALASCASSRTGLMQSSSTPRRWGVGSSPGSGPRPWTVRAERVERGPRPGVVPGAYPGNRPSREPARIGRIIATAPRTGQPVKRLPTPQVRGGGRSSGRGSGGLMPSPPGSRGSRRSQKLVRLPPPSRAEVLRSSTSAPTKASPNSRSSTSPSGGSPAAWVDAGAWSRTSIRKRSTPSTRSTSIGSVRPARFRSPTATAQVSETATLRSSMPSAPIPALRATMPTTRRTVPSSRGSGGKASRTVAGSTPATASTAAPLLGRGRDGVAHRAVDREDLGQAGDAEDLEDLLLGADELERAVVVADPLEPADQHAETGRVQEVDLLEVDDDVVGPVADQLDELLAELRRGVDVDLAGHFEHRVAAILAHVEVEIHPLSSLAAEDVQR